MKWKTSTQHRGMVKTEDFFFQGIWNWKLPGKNTKVKTETTQITVKENNKDYYKARIDCCVGKFYCQASNPVKYGVQKGSPARVWRKRPQTVLALDQPCKTCRCCWLAISLLVGWVHTGLTEGHTICRYGL